MIESRISDRNNPLVLEFELDNDNGSIFANYSFRGSFAKYTELGVIYNSDLCLLNSKRKYTKEYTTVSQINTPDTKYSICTDFPSSDMRSIGFLIYTFYLVYERR